MYLSSMPTVSSLHIYPVKSLGGIALNSVAVTDRGFQYDRRWMLIDNNHRFLSQRELPVMTLLQTELVEQSFRIYKPGEKENNIEIPLSQESGELLVAEIWGNTCEVTHVSTIADKWFSKQLDTACRLVYMPDNSRLAIDEKYYSGGITSLSDGFPILMVSQASLALLNQKSGWTLEMARFRPNLIITDCAAHEEDRIARLEVNGIPMQGVKHCARCSVTTIDPKTGGRTKEPLMSLATYRQINNKVYFGEYIVPETTGTISVGDEIKVVEWKAGDV